MMKLFLVITSTLNPLITVFHQFFQEVRIFRLVIIVILLTFSQIKLSNGNYLQVKVFEKARKMCSKISKSGQLS